MFAKPYGTIAGKFRAKNKYKYDKKFLYKTYTHLFSADECSAYSIISPDIDKNNKYELYIPEDKEKRAVEYFKQTACNNKIIIFNGEGSDKNISSVKITATLKQLLNNFPEYHFFILGYSAYIDKYREIISTIHSPNMHITYKTDIQDTFALIKEADLLISVDTALIHIASAVGTNVCEIVSYGMKGNVVGRPNFVDYIICECQSDKFDLDKYNIDDIINAVKILI